MNTNNFTVAYPHQMRPSRYDGTHFLCYLNESSAEYKADEEAAPVAGYSYTGPMADGGTLIECDEWDRNKLINGVLRSRYSQTEEDAIKTHRLQRLAVQAGLEEMEEDRIETYDAEWDAFEAFRTETIRLVDGWDDWA